MRWLHRLKMKTFKTRQYATILGTFCCLGLIWRNHLPFGIDGSLSSISEQHSLTQVPLQSIEAESSESSGDRLWSAGSVAAYVDSLKPLVQGQSHTDGPDNPLGVLEEHSPPTGDKAASSGQEEDALRSLVNEAGPQSNSDTLNGHTKGGMKDKAIVVGVGPEADVTWLQDLSDEWVTLV